MTLTDLIQLVSLKLGEQTLFYPPEEVVSAGLNPAQRLLCLVYPLLLRTRYTWTVNADLPFIDLRQITDANSVIVGNRIRRVVRVILGDVSADTPVINAATGEYRELVATSIKRLAATNDWMAQKGEVRKYWLWGKLWLGLYKRPIDTTTVTIIFDAAPVPFSLVTPDQVPSVQSAYHPVIAEVAAGLLLQKEGKIEGERGLQKITQALNLKQGAAA